MSKIIKKVDELDVNAVLASENKKLMQESLSVVKEVRNELITAYKDLKASQSTVEQLSREKEGLISDNKEVESLRTELDDIKKKDKEVEQLAYTKRLNKLSENFVMLGQHKSVEHLSTLSVEIIGEFEEITNAALDRKSDEKLNVETTPTQSMAKKEVKMSDKKPERLTNEGFLKDIGRRLTEQQSVEGGDSKRIIKL